MDDDEDDRGGAQHNKTNLSHNQAQDMPMLCGSIGSCKAWAALMRDFLASVWLMIPTLDTDWLITGCCQHAHNAEWYELSAETVRGWHWATICSDNTRHMGGMWPLTIIACCRGRGRGQHTWSPPTIPHRGHIALSLSEGGPANAANIALVQIMFT